MCIMRKFISLNLMFCNPSKHNFERQFPPLLDNFTAFLREREREKEGESKIKVGGNLLSFREELKLRLPNVSVFSLSRWETNEPCDDDYKESWEGKLSPLQTVSFDGITHKTTIPSLFILPAFFLFPSDYVPCT